MIERNGYLERIWKVKYNKNMFDFYIFIRGTEPEMQKYLESEMGHVGSYTACISQEERAIDELGIKIYIAPKE